MGVELLQDFLSQRCVVLAERLQVRAQGHDKGRHGVDVWGESAGLHMCPQVGLGIAELAPKPVEAAHVHCRDMLLPLRCRADPAAAAVLERAAVLLGQMCVDVKSLPGAVSKATGMQLHVVCVILPRAFPATLELAQDRECIHFGAQKAHRRTAILNGTRGPALGTPLRVL
eukprot:CAMPEP_0174331982 /NCGR_PEP_ID=MMETSP0810-20121108/17925_1 /TAXON_ID=73025 ORGANISM="Eutreptiella gymnastica-like, Strain CCMP1594" /NCGR_SAMPLE_ID=MMETSP0810 /ASSEMBLY_ACC=CAM_ASM_000659 /LENGTH=170 /DNA_ID=CAMNT_0015448101 /DNA_START=999 /DNA_END=1511 /DNA_ORIENTATION=-